MTLITEITLPGKIVIAGDKRLRDRQKTTDDQIKLVPISNQSIGAITGSPRFLNPANREPQFDAYAEMAEFFADRPLAPETLTEFCMALNSRFGKFVKEIKPKLPFRSDGFMTLIVYSYVEGAVRHDWIRLDLEEGNLAISNRRSVPCTDSRLNAFGDIDVIEELCRGNVLLYELLARPDVKKIIVKQMQCPFESVTEGEAVHFLKDITGLCSEHMATLEKAASISPNCDIAIIDNAGFRWVQGGPPAEGP